jgi:hypothetical protein
MPRITPYSRALQTLSHTSDISREKYLDADHSEQYPQSVGLGKRVELLNLLDALRADQDRRNDKS